MDDVAAPSNALKARGVRIYCVGVGRYINGRQLDIMASPPRKNHIFTADWTHLGIVVNELRNAICLGRFFNLILFPGEHLEQRQSRLSQWWKRPQCTNSSSTV